MRVGRIRLLVQFLCFLLMIYGGLLLINLGRGLPAYTCVYVKHKAGLCFLYPLQRFLGLPFFLLLGQYGVLLLKYMGMFFLWVVVFNRAWCGWVCPIGFLQDLLTKIRGYLNVEPSRFSWITRDRYQSVKYILLVLLILLPIGIGNSFFGLPKLTSDLAVPFCQICPAKPLLPIFDGNFNHIFIDFSSNTRLVLSSLSMIILGLFFAASFLKSRFLCSYCPMSALASLFDKIGLLSLKKDSQKCTRCGNCARVCPMEIREVAEDRERTNMVTQDCMLCMRCIEACPEDNALRATFAGLTIFPSSAKGFLKRQGAFSKQLTSGSHGA